jgi:translation initiation factor SUI1
MIAFDEVENSNTKKIIDIRMKQRNGKKMITSVENIESLGCDLSKVSEHLRKNLHCAGFIKDQVIVLTGDHRLAVRDFLLKEKLTEKEMIRVHGY